MNVYAVQIGTVKVNETFGVIFINNNSNNNFQCLIHTKLKLCIVTKNMYKYGLVCSIANVAINS